MLNRIIPLLNNLVPMGLAVKGLEKVDPRFKQFFTGAAAAGYGLNEAMDFLKNKFLGGSQSNINRNARPDVQASQKTIEQSQQGPNLARSALTLGGAALGGLGGAGLSLAANAGSPEQNQKNPKNLDYNALEQQAMELEQNAMQKQADPFSELDPQLANFIKGHLQNGRTPEEAAAIAKNSSAFSKLIPSIERKTKMNFVDFINKLFGANNFQSQQQNSQQQQGQKGQQALMNILQKIHQSRGA